MAFLVRFIPLTLISLLLVGCGLLGGGGGEETIDADAQQAQIWLQLECTDQCRTRGQCGFLEDEQAVVLGHSESPHTTDHNILFPAGTLVTERQTQFRTASSERDGQLNVTFHEVQAEGGPRGWVAEWCVIGVEPDPPN